MNRNTVDLAFVKQILYQLYSDNLCSPEG